jgi:hypothetical protein
LLVDDMTTAATLESLADRSRFEHLATSVLRKAEPRYSAVIHTGVNAQGETIVAPIDGLHLIFHSNPPHYLFVQHTTTDRERLRGKWLSKKDADLPKAAAEAKKVRQKQPQAVFTVVLTTNQRVDQQLVLDVHQRAHGEQVAVDIWEQSRLADFLDTTADGHWLRRCYLGIEAERLSTDLLHQLGRRSLELYQQEVLLPGHGPLVHRDLIESIIATALSGGLGLCLVAGRSGCGKSVATAQALDRWLSGGSLGLWLPARFIRDAGSLEAALDGWLRSLHPVIQPDAGRVAIDLGGKGGRLLLCVDDINRTPEAARLLRLAVSLAAPPSGSPGQAKPGGGRPALADSLCQVVPVWPEQLTSLPQMVLEKPWVRIVAVGDLLPDEASGMIRVKVPNLSPVAAREYAMRLHHDPFLVGLFTLMADERMDAPRLGAVADDAIGQFLDAQLREICSAGAVDLLLVELLDSLTRVAREMILRRNLQPSFGELERWLGDGSKVLRGMRLLIRQGQVCRLDAEGRLDFRHDRLQERFLVQAMDELLQLPEPPEYIITDPYYSAIVGKALAQTVLPAERIARLRSSAPWAVFEAIRQVVEPSNEYQDRLFQEARTWAANESQSVPDSVLTAICWTLIESDSSRVLPIINAMKPNALLMAAGLRNGSAHHGMRFVRGTLRHGFEPGRGDALRDRIVEHAGHRHGEELAGQFREQLSVPDLVALDANAYLSLLGHFRFAGFGELILEVWRRHQDEVLAYAIWAAARCPLQDVGGVLGPMVSRLAALPVREDYTKSLSDREWMTLYLGWGFRRGISSEALACFLEAGRRDQVFRRDVSLMVEGVDHPDAVEFLVRHLAEGGGSNLWSHLTGIGDGEPEVRLRSLQTTDRLRSLWQSPGETEKVRTQAFCLWLQTTGCKDATLLATVEAESPFHHYAVQHRIKLGDSSVVPDLLELLRSDDLRGWWWVLAHRVWCEELRSFASGTLGSFRDEIPSDFSGGREDLLHNLAEILVKIPVTEGEGLLRQHWGHLKYSPWLIHAAFRIGTPTCVGLARQALSICPADVDIFQLAFSTVWNQRNPANPITLQHLESLEPYLDRMSRIEVLFLAWETERVVGGDEKVAEWIRTHAVPRLPPEDQVRVQVADQMLVGNLDRNFKETRFEPYLKFLFEERSGQRFVFPERQLRLLDDWLSNHRTVRGLQVAAECLKHIGTRRDLALLDRYPIEGDVGDVERTKVDARFSLRRRTLV